LHEQRKTHARLPDNGFRRLSLRSNSLRYFDEKSCGCRRARPYTTSESIGGTERFMRTPTSNVHILTVREAGEPICETVAAEDYR
jgi:hypothetical protein